MPFTKFRVNCVFLLTFDTVIVRLGHGFPALPFCFKDLMTVFALSQRMPLPSHSLQATVLDIVQSFIMSISFLLEEVLVADVAYLENQRAL